MKEKSRTTHQLTPSLPALPGTAATVVANALQPVIPRKAPFTTEEAAEIIGVKKGTLEVWRVQGRGPRFLKLGRAVRYRQADLDDFLNENMRLNTSQA